MQSALVNERQQMHSKITPDPDQLRFAVFANTISKEPVDSETGYHIDRSTHTLDEIERNFRYFWKGQEIVQLQISTITDLKKMVQAQETIDLLTPRFLIWAREDEGSEYIDMVYSGTTKLPWTELRAKQAFYLFEIFTILFRDIAWTKGYHWVIGDLEMAETKKGERAAILTQSELGELRIVTEFTAECFDRLLVKIEEHLNRIPTNMY